MTSVVAISRHLGLFQEGIDCGFALTLLFDDVVGNINRPFRFAVIGELDPLIFSHQADVATLLAVTKSGYGQQPKGTKKQATPEPSDAAMAFVLSNGSAKDGARYPEEKQRKQEAHHQSVTAL